MPSRFFTVPKRQNFGEVEAAALRLGGLGGLPLSRPSIMFHGGFLTREEGASREPSVASANSRIIYAQVFGELWEQGSAALLNAIWTLGRGSPAS